MSARYASSPVPDSMDARNWAHVARLRRITVGSPPHVGAVAVWPRLTQQFRHVAYVTRLEPGGGFDVGQYNLPDVGDDDSFAFDVRRDVPRAGAVFLYVPKKAES